ncbi:hypothetical protein QLL95_gp0208 [Cotonvirus japonicus]|uniref:Uncharacterized protein n=1 Tax=Cotonvirus japonicus TaxID=2811091 RepID=A0ABM7NRH8_9VIRU|nr:hypothetical protein QLL95_gp0208 [Cotonvirus japonicus]BCS82697.1 hypothetical protein [Cotonvirus japonicus]
MACEIRICVDFGFDNLYLGCQGIHLKDFDIESVDKLLELPINTISDKFSGVISEILSYHKNRLKSNNIDTTKLSKHIFCEMVEDIFIINILIADKFIGKIVDFYKVMPPHTDNHKFGVTIPAYFFELNLLAEHLEYIDLFLMLVNRFVVEYDVTIDGDITNNNYVRFMLHRDHYTSSTYGYGYLRNIDSCLESHQRVLKLCPENYVPGEISMPYNRGYFIFINKSAWHNKIITPTDLVRVYE